MSNENQAPNENNENQTPKPSGNQTIVVNVVSTHKDATLAALLAFFLGPLGMLYTTALGASIMLIVSLPVAFFTFGLGLLITQPICIIWSVLAASSHNAKQSAHVHNTQ